jgi:hypothetical protein
MDINNLLSRPTNVNHTSIYILYFVSAPTCLNASASILREP